MTMMLLLLLLLRCSDNNLMRWWWFYGMLAHGMIKFKTKLSINWYTIIVIAIPSYRFFSFSTSSHPIPSFKLLNSLTRAHDRSTGRSHSFPLSLDHPFIPHLKKCTFCFYYALFAVAACLCVSFILAFFVTFRFFY